MRPKLFFDTAVDWMIRQVDAALERNEDQLRAAWPQYPEELDQRQRSPDTEEELILRRSVALQQYREQLTERMRRLQGIAEGGS